MIDDEEKFVESSIAQEKKLKFLFISSDKFPPFRQDVAILFGKEIVSRGHVIDWILQSDEPCEHEYRVSWSGCNVWVGATDLGSSRVRRLKKHVLSIKNDLKMFSLARKKRYDFIQVKDKIISALMTLIVVKLYRTKFIYWLSYPFPEAYIYGAKVRTARYPFIYFIRGIIFKFFLYHMIMPRADHIFVQSDQMKKDVEYMGVPGRKLTPVPMGVNLQNIPYSEKETISNEDDGEKRVLYLGTLIKVRKVDFIIRVFQKVLHELPSAKLYLIGGSDDPSDEQILKYEAQKLGIEESVIFTGFLPMIEAWKYVRKADVCVSPFYPIPILNSTSPTKLIEYMAMGKPVVANDHPEQIKVIAESGAGICVPYEEDAFALAILKLIKNFSMAQKMGLKGRRYVEVYRNYSKIAEMVETQYYKICKSIKIE